MAQPIRFRAANGRPTFRPTNVVTFRPGYTITTARAFGGGIAPVTSNHIAIRAAVISAGGYGLAAASKHGTAGATIEGGALPHVFALRLISWVDFDATLTVSRSFEGG